MACVYCHLQTAVGHGELRAIGDTKVKIHDACLENYTRAADPDALQAHPYPVCRGRGHIHFVFATYDTSGRRRVRGSARQR